MFVSYEEIDGEYVDVGHEVIETETKVIAILLKSLEPMIFGYDDNKWYFIDYVLHLEFHLQMQRNLKTMLLDFNLILKLMRE